MMLHKLLLAGMLLAVPATAHAQQLSEYSVKLVRVTRDRNDLIDLKWTNITLRITNHSRSQSMSFDFFESDAKVNSGSYTYLLGFIQDEQERFIERVTIKPGRSATVLYSMQGHPKVDSVSWRYRDTGWAERPSRRSVRRTPPLPTGKYPRAAAPRQKPKSKPLDMRLIPTHALSAGAIFEDQELKKKGADLSRCLVKVTSTGEVVRLVTVKSGGKPGVYGWVPSDRLKKLPTNVMQIRTRTTEAQQKATHTLARDTNLGDAGTKVVVLARRDGDVRALVIATGKVAWIPANTVTPIKR